jgi:transcriptional regulator with XRE-family HTH domain
MMSGMLRLKPEMLRRARLARHLTQEEVAHRLGVSAARVTQLETKKHINIRLSTLGELQDALSTDKYGKHFPITLHELIGRDNGSRQP